MKKNETMKERRKKNGGWEEEKREEEVCGCIGVYPKPYTDPQDRCRHF